MFLYNKSMINDFKFPFNGIENINQNYSQALQDMFVLSVLDGKRDGTFLEIGAFDAQFLSNTYLLEKEYNWNGTSIDINESTRTTFNSSERKSKVIIDDAIKLDYNLILSGITDYRCDYLSLDIEPMTNTLECLKKLPLDNFRFSVITYEHDYYDPNFDRTTAYAVRQESRDILEFKGYVLVNPSVENIGEDEFEDWYIDGTYFNDSIINKFKRNNSIPLKARCYMLDNVE